MENNPLTIDVKNEINFEDFKEVDAKLIIVLGYFSLFCYENKLDCKISSIKEEVQGRQTTTHRDGRAFDASIRSFGNGDILKCIEFMNKHVGHLGAYSASDGEQRVIVYHDIGKGPHFHFQVHR